MVNFQNMCKRIDSTSLFDWFQGTAGEYYLFHFGVFVCSCVDTFELQEAQESVLRGRIEWIRVTA